MGTRCVCVLETFMISKRIYYTPEEKDMCLYVLVSNGKTAAPLFEI